MLTTSCPKCEKEVTVPASANAESRVRCPLCSEEYTLEHVFSDLPPLLELLDAPANNGASVDEGSADAAGDAPAAAGIFDFGQSETDTSDKPDGDMALAEPVETVSKSSGFDFGDSSSSTGTSGGSVATASRRSRPRQKGSPMKSIIGVILGGLLAIPVAQLFLWWVMPFCAGLFGWELHIDQIDPMSVGRNLSGSFVQFIVPPSVRNPEAIEDETAAVDPGTANPTTPTGNEDDPDDDPGFEGLLGQNGNGPRGANGNRNGGTGNGDANNANSNDIDDNDADGNAPGGASDGEPADDGNADGNSDSGSVEPPPQPKSPVKNAPAYTSSDLAAELKVVTEEVKRFDNVNDQALSFGERKSIRDDFFAAVAQLAEVTTFVDEKPDGHREHLRSILHDAASTAGKRRMIGVSSNLIIQDESRSANGIILAGEVTEINKRGPTLHEAIVALDTKTRPPVSVLGTSDPRKSFRVGEQVMILGMIIDKPKDEIRDYVGPDETVVWGGYSQVVPTLDEE